eukprot:6253570-Prymnesium_polylepis.1
MPASPRWWRRGPARPPCATSAGSVPCTPRARAARSDRARRCRGSAFGRPRRLWACCRPTRWEQLERAARPAARARECCTRRGGARVALIEVARAEAIERALVARARRLEVVARVQLLHLPRAVPRAEEGLRRALVAVVARRVPARHKRHQLRGGGGGSRRGAHACGGPAPPGARRWARAMGRTSACMRREGRTPQTPVLMYGIDECGSRQP